MPRMMNKPNGHEWPDPRDLTPALEDGELPGPLFNLLDASDYRGIIELFLDGTRHRYTISAHFDEPIREGFLVVDWKMGKIRVVRFVSEAGTWNQFKRDFYDAVKEFLRGESFRQYGRAILARKK